MRRPTVEQLTVGARRADSRHPVFLKGKYDTGFIDEYMDGGKGGDVDGGDEEVEARRVAQIMAAIAAFRRDKERAAKATSNTGGGGGGDPWKDYGRRLSMRGGLR